MGLPLKFTRGTGPRDPNGVPGSRDECCFVLLLPTPEEYRAPRVSASKLFPPLLPSLATPGPPLPYRPLQKARYYYPGFRFLEWSVRKKEGPA